MSDVESYEICQRISLINSRGFESLRLNKYQYIKKLLQTLIHHKQATQKMFQKLAEKPRNKKPFVYTLDTAEFLLKSREIAIYFKNNLLLFS